MATSHAPDRARESVGQERWDFFFSSRRRHTRLQGDWSSDVCSSDLLERGLSTASKGGSHPKAYRNYKQLLADKDIQAVLIATPEHWHHRMVLDALAEIGRASCRERV